VRAAPVRPPACRPRRVLLTARGLSLVNMPPNRGCHQFGVAARHTGVRCIRLTRTKFPAIVLDPADRVLDQPPRLEQVGGAAPDRSAPAEAGRES
jgi:hypothetical protein